MLLLSKDEIKSFYSLKDCISAVKEAFRLFSAGKVEVPLRTQIVKEKGDGSFLCMPAYCEEYDASCVKILNMFPNNIQKGLATINAEVLVMSPDTGEIEGMLDGNYVTQLRTGAASGVAIDLLGKKTCHIGALIGTGGQAATQLEAMLIVRKLQEVRIYDQDLLRGQNFVAEMSQELAKYGTKLILVNSGNEAVGDADVIITVTPSNTPVFDGNLVKNGAIVCGVGSYQPQMQEIPSSLLERAEKIYFDSEEAVLSEAGDLLIPLKEKQITREKFTGDIGEVIGGNLIGRENDEEIIFFKTVGIAAQDLITAKSIFDKGRSLGKGLQWK